MARLNVPTVSVIIGEGGSGGALALALTDRVLMLENSVYSVITPEACAAILWKDSGEAHLAAQTLRMTSADLAGLEVVDEVLPEPRGGAHRDHGAAARIVKDALEEQLRELETMNPRAEEEGTFREVQADGSLERKRADAVLISRLNTAGRSWFERLRSGDLFVPSSSR